MLQKDYATCYTSMRANCIDIKRASHVLQSQQYCNKADSGEIENIARRIYCFIDLFVYLENRLIDSLIHSFLNVLLHSYFDFSLFSYLYMRSFMSSRFF